MNAITQTKETQNTITPSEALDMLKSGNERFKNKNPLTRDYDSQIAQTSKGQFPFAAVVACIDSRLPIETIFDQGIGDVFAARVAGNFVNTDILGSLEFACKVAGTKAILVLGHTSCGAVKGACDGVELGNLTSMLGKIKPAVDAITDIQDDRTSANADFVQKVAEMNVKMTVQNIYDQSPVLNAMQQSGEITIAGGMYDVSTGTVKFIE